MYANPGGTPGILITFPTPLVTLARFNPLAAAPVKDTPASRSALSHSEITTISSDLSHLQGLSSVF